MNEDHILIVIILQRAFAIIFYIVYFRQLKIEGATALYITKLSNVFFTSLVECHKEFCRLFSQCKGFKSGSSTILFYFSDYVMGNLKSACLKPLENDMFKMVENII